MAIQNIVWRFDFDDSSAQKVFALMRERLAKVNGDFNVLHEKVKGVPFQSVKNVGDNLQSAENQARRASKALDLLAEVLDQVDENGNAINPESIDNLGKNAQKAELSVDELAESIKGFQKEINNIDTKPIDKIGDAATKNADKVSKAKKKITDSPSSSETSSSSDSSTDKQSLKDETKRLKDEQKARDKIAKDAEREREKSEAEARAKQDKADKERFENEGLTGASSRFNDSLGSAREFKEKIAEGDLGGAFESFKNIGGSLSAIASPAGIAVGAVAAVGAALAVTTNAAIEGAAKIAEYKKQIFQITGLKGQAQTDFAVDIGALTETFGIDTEQLITTINTLAKNRNLSIQQATNIVQDQLLRGLGSEGLIQLNEYDIQLKEIGLTAIQSADFIRKAQQEGFYDDKAVDALKETNIKLSEFSQSTIDALKPLGTKFNEQLSKDLQEGKKTAFQVFTDIAIQAKKSGLTSQQTQLLVADAFGGSPGEDAWRDKLINFVAKFGSELNNIREPLTKTQQATLNLVEAEKDLQAEFAIFNDQTLGTANTYKLLGTQIQTFFTQIVNYLAPIVGIIANFINGLVKNSEPVVIVFRSLYTLIGQFFGAIGQLVSTILPSFNSNINVASLVMQALGGAFEFVTFGARAFIATLTLLTKGYALVINASKQLSNTLLRTNFQIDPNVNLNSFKKDIDNYKTLAKNGFLIANKDVNKQSQDLIDSNDKFNGFKAKPVVSDAGDAPKFEIKLEANTKPFDDAVAKINDDLIKIGQESIITKIQFEYDVSREISPIAQDLQAQVEQRFQERKSQFTLQNEITTINKTTELRRETAFKELSEKLAEQKKTINDDIKNEVEKQKQLRLLNDKFNTERLKIEDKYENEKTANAKIIAQKQADFIEANERAAILVRLKTINILQDKVRQEVDEASLKSLSFTTSLIDNNTNFDAQKQNAKDTTNIQNAGIENKRFQEVKLQNNGIAKLQEELNANQLKLQNETDIKKKIALQKAIKETEKIILLSNQEILLINQRSLQAQIELRIQLADKISAIERAKQEEQIRIENEQAERIEENLKRATESVNKINEITAKINLPQTSLSAGISTAITGATGLFNNGLDIVKSQREADKKRRDAQSEILKQQRRKTVIDQELERAKADLELKKQNNGGTAEDKQAVEDAQKKVDELKSQSDAINKNVEELDEALKKLNDIEFKELLKKLLNLAEVVSNSVFAVLQAVSQATIEELDKNIEKQKEQISAIEQGLNEGGEANKNYSTEQLEVERERLKQTQKLRDEELQKQNDYMVAQLVINGAIAVAQTFATVPFPANIVAAALVIGSLIASIAAVKSQMKAQKAEKGIVNISDAHRPYTGLLYGPRHAEGGILIEAEGGESIMNRSATAKYGKELDQMNKGKFNIENHKEIVLQKFNAFAELIAPPKIEYLNRPALFEKIIALHDEGVRLNINNKVDLTPIQNEMRQLTRRMDKLMDKLDKAPNAPKLMLDGKQLFLSNKKHSDRYNRIRNHRSGN